MMMPIANFYTVIWVSVPSLDEETPPERGTRIRAATPRRRSAFRWFGERLAGAIGALSGTPQQHPAPVRVSVTR